MTDIPEDIKETARALAQTRWLHAAQQDSLAKKIAAALLSERSRQIERDAKIADAEVSQWLDMCKAHPNSDWQCAVDACRDVADLIRGQEP